MSKSSTIHYREATHSRGSEEIFSQISPSILYEAHRGGYSRIVAMRLRKDPELDATDPELAADILTIIPDKISGA